MADGDFICIQTKTKQIGARCWFQHKLEGNWHHSSQTDFWYLSQKDLIILVWGKYASWLKIFILEVEFGCLWSFWLVNCDFYEIYVCIFFSTFFSKILMWYCVKQHVNTTIFLSISYQSFVRFYIHIYIHRIPCYY